MEGIDLSVLGYSSENHQGSDARQASVSSDALVYLDGQFAGRGQDEGADTTAPLVGTGLPVQYLQDGRSKGGCFARAGLGTSQEVFPGQYFGDSLLLNGGWGSIA